MHDLTGDRQAVLRVLERTIHYLEEDRPETASTGVETLALPSTRAWQPRRDEIVERLQAAYEWDRREGQIAETAAFVPEMRARVRAPGVTDEPWYVPRNRTIALFQSAMNEYLERKSEQQPEMRGLAESEQFDTSDPGWISVALQRLRALFRGKAKFPKHRTAKDFRFELDNSARIALVSDWGTGNQNARAVASEIAKRKPHHIIHLGDIYYSGDEGEARRHFLDVWPKPSGVHRSWALNANHEMYSGGYGYFKVTLPAFDQPASYFNLGNDHWRFIGLDSGYVDHNFNAEQADWLAGQMEDGSKKVLLTHHQLYSAFEGQGDKMERWVDGMLTSRKIEAWFWGHEHKLIIYDRVKGVKGRCIGHGSIPFFIPPEHGENDDVPIKFIHTRGRPDRPDRGVHGFALLTLEGKNLHVDYIDQDGKKAFEEDL
jgi:hypothetical protein